MNRKIRGLNRVFHQLPSFILNPKRKKVEIVTKSRIKPIRILFFKNNLNGHGINIFKTFKISIREMLKMDIICLI